MPSKIEELERRVRFNPDPKNYFYLAEAYRDELNFEKALDACNKGLEKQPNLISGQVLLAEILFKLSRVDESIKLLNDILKRAPENTLAYRILYEACMQKKDFQCAKSALEKLFFFNPFNDEISLKLKEINRIIERKEETIPAKLPEEEFLLERGSAEMKEEKVIPSLPEEPFKEEVEEKFATKRIEAEDLATMAREIKEKVEEEAFVTPTMAEIYLRQGLIDKAVETYYKLYETKKDEAFLKRARELEERVAKSTYYSTYANLLEKLLEKISQMKQGRNQ